LLMYRCYQRYFEARTEEARPAPIAKPLYRTAAAH
jgi:hypothetical protein